MKSVLCLLVTLCPSLALAGAPCRVVVPSSKVVVQGFAHQKVALLQQVYPAAYYSVGAELREEAITARILARIEQQFAEAMQRAAIAGASAATATASAAVVEQTMTQQKCGSCHGGENPKGGLSLSALADIDCETKLAAIRRIVTDDEDLRMPKGAHLTPEEAGQLIQELSR